MANRNEFAMRQMIEDMRQVAQLSIEQIDQLSQALLKVDGIPSTDQLIELIAKSVEPPDACVSVVTVLQNLAPDSQEQASATVSQTLATVSLWRELNEQNRTAFSDDLFEALGERLSRLLCEYPAVFRYRKATRLAGLTGNISDGVEVLCDIRPVFSRDRDEIVGLIPITTLRVSYESQDGEDHVIELDLPEAVLNELAEKVGYAKQKLGVIQQTGSRWLPRGIAEGL